MDLAFVGAIQRHNLRMQFEAEIGGIICRGGVQSSASKARTVVASGRRVRPKAVAASRSGTLSLLAPGHAGSAHILADFRCLKATRAAFSRLVN